VDETGAEYVRVIFKNDGRPFPNGFSFEEYKRLGGRAGKNKASGLGGFFINRVIDLHGGQFNYISVNPNSIDPFKVQFEILLPTSHE
jgi:type I restriction enzyme M protein